MRSFVAEIGMSQNQLAHLIGVPDNRIHAIVNGSSDITPTPPDRRAGCQNQALEGGPRTR
jgi:plasmid maintenance system antidote protein VapI